MIDVIAEQIIKGIIVANSKTGITCDDIGRKYFECVGEALPLARNEKKMIEYLKSIHCLNAFYNERDELIWYIRGKNLKEKTRGEICRSRPMKKSPSNRFCGKNQTNKRMSGAGSASSAANKSDYSDLEYEPKTSASLYNYDLVGDDFFLHMAKIDLKCREMKPGSLDQCGLCASGQTIAEATARIRRFSDTNNMRLIINIGSIDIMTNRFMVDICNDYINLVKICRKRKIDIVITTLAPIIHLLFDESSCQKVRQFNDFLISKFGSMYPVIDITHCMKSQKTNKVSFGCYRPKPSHVKGSKHRSTHFVTLWNHVGRQRILKHIKSLLPL